MNKATKPGELREHSLVQDVKAHIEAITIGLRYLLRQPITLKYPEVIELRPEGYRGFIIYDKTKCLGCGLCAQICPSKAIKMVKSMDSKRPRPSYNLARCIFCGLCVDICPTNSLDYSPVHDVAFYDVNEMFYDPEKWHEASQKLTSIMRRYRLVKAVIDEEKGIRYEAIND